MLGPRSNLVVREFPGKIADRLLIVGKIEVQRSAPFALVDLSRQSRHDLARAETYRE